MDSYLLQTARVVLVCSMNITLHTHFICHSHNKIMQIQMNVPWTMEDAKTYALIVLDLIIAYVTLGIYFLKMESHVKV